MNKEHIKRQFAVRVRENYVDFLKDWLSSEPEMEQKPSPVEQGVTMC